VGLFKAPALQITNSEKKTPLKAYYPLVKAI